MHTSKRRLRRTAKPISRITLCNRADFDMIRLATGCGGSTSCRSRNLVLFKTMVLKPSLVSSMGLAKAVTSFINQGDCLSVNFSKHISDIQKNFPRISLLACLYKNSSQDLPYFVSDKDDQISPGKPGFIFQFDWLAGLC